VFDRAKADPVAVRLLGVERRGHAAHITLDPVLVQLLGDRYGRALDTDTYWRLGLPTARRLYRFLDCARWAGPTRRDELAPTLDALRQHLPVDRRHPSQIRRTLEPAHAQLVAAGVLRAASFEPRRAEGFRRPVWHAVYAWPGRAEREVAVPFARDGHVGETVGEILRVLRDEHSAGFYVKVARALGAEPTRALLGSVKQSMHEGTSLDAARRIFTATAKRRALEAGIVL
jgi:hypothetical protein